MTDRPILPQPFKISNMKNWILIYMLLTGNYLFAQVIPVGFLKAKFNTSIPTGTNPVTTNLLLYLDATRRASYDASGSIWYDISGVSPANSATLVGNPTFSDANGVGSFTYGIHKYALTSKLITSNLSSATFIAWVNPSQLQDDYTGIIISRNGYSSATGNASGMFISLNNPNNNVGYVWNGGQNTYSWRNLLNIPNNEWSMIAVSISPGSATAYLCKSSGISTAVNSVTHSEITGLKFYVGIDPYFEPLNRGFIGKMGTSMVYSTALTYDNISAIFNAQKAAFGIN
jgi:hypothetical protein